MFSTISHLRNLARWFRSGRANRSSITQASPVTGGRGDRPTFDILNHRFELLDVDLFLETARDPALQKALRRAVGPGGTSRDGTSRRGGRADRDAFEFEDR